MVRPVLTTFCFSMDYESFLSYYGRHTFLNQIRETARLLESPDMIMFAGGVPNPKNFPIETITMKLRDGTCIEWDEATTGRALQYLPSDGIPDFLDEIKKLVKRYHDPPRLDELRFCLSSGSQDALNKAFTIIANPGDYIIVPTPCYLGVFGILKPLGAKMLEIPLDDEGMCVEELRKALQKIGKSHPVKAMYMNPNSSNPSCITYSLKRRKELYQVAQEFNFLIIEDDAYYFLNFAKERPPSFLALDVDGRVLRVDSFSKLIAPGLRLGFVSGPSLLVAKIESCIQSSTQQASSLSQLMVYHILKKWGEHGLNRHVARICSFYKNQALTMMESAKKHLTGLAEWDVPDGGMFMWIKIPSMKDTTKFAFHTAASFSVLVVPGKGFIPSGSDSAYVRVAFSLVPPEQINEGIKRLATAIREQCKTINENNAQSM